MAFKLGYGHSSEEHRPQEMVRYAKLAEQAGFSFASISDHFHPWTDTQGQSPFVWSVIGGISQTTETSPLVTTVTCPIMRIHPAIIAQAAATSAAMMAGRFMLGVGSGEALNEHITGEQWPPIETRLEMLEEAVYIIRELWKGETWTFYGDFFTVENARIYTLPDKLPPILFAAAGKKSGELAGRLGDGLISTAPHKEVVEAFEGAGGGGKPKIGGMKVAYAQSEDEGAKIALKYWATSGIPGQASQELTMPQHFEQVAKLVTKDIIRKEIVCGPDANKHVEQINKYVEAGFDHVYVMQCGPDQEAFIRFYKEQVMPKLQLDRAPAMVSR